MAEEVTLVMVMSVDGRVTRGDEVDVRPWSSREDQEHFAVLVEAAEVIVMGRKTYEVAKHLMEHKFGRVRIVMTRHPENYNDNKWVKFTNKIPRMKNMLVVGGSEVAAIFLREKLITRLLVTVEPVVFGGGKNLLNGLITGVNLKLEKFRQLNDQGTLLLEYRVEYED